MNYNNPLDTRENVQDEEPRTEFFLGYLLFLSFHFLCATISS